MKRVYSIHEFEEEIRRYLRKKGWALLDCSIDAFAFDAYQTLYGLSETEKVIQELEQIVVGVLKEMGAPEDVLGSENANHFFIITSEVTAPDIKKTLKTRFNSEILAHYSAVDRDRGYIVNSDNEKAPLIFLSVGMALSSGFQRGSIKDIFNR